MALELLTTPVQLFVILEVSGDVTSIFSEMPLLTIPGVFPVLPLSQPLTALVTCYASFYLYIVLLVVSLQG